MNQGIQQTTLISSSKAIANLLQLSQDSYKNIPFYRNSFSKVPFSSPTLRVADLPILTKSVVREAKQTMVLPGAEKHPLIVRDNTSGSTGIPLDMFRTVQEVITCARSLWNARQRLFADVLDAPGVIIFPSRGISVNTQLTKPKNCGTTVLSTNSLTMDNVSSFLDKLDFLRPAWLQGPPVLLSVIAEALKRDNRQLKSKLVFIESQGDWLNPSTRNLLEEVFNCHVANHYGTRETYTIAYECPNKNMHIFDDCVVVELLAHPTSEEYEIIVSSIIFKIMPFIRYKIGDTISNKEQTCSCGNKCAVLGTIRGRIGELIAGTNLIGNHVFHNVILRLTTSSHAQTILQYQVHQLSLNNFDVQLVLKDVAQLQKLGENFQELANEWLPSARFSFQAVEHAALLASGKTQAFVTHL